MASLDKLIKSFEILKIQMHNENVTVRKQEMRSIPKKEKILHLNLIHESLISPSVKQTNEFTKVLSHAIETFIIYFDDDDQDVYFVAEDCLNKTVKCLIETHVGRLKIEFYRFVRRNESEKCLKAALTRFAELCHLIRPQKSRQFAEFFIKENPMKKIALRQEESIQNILISVMTKLCSSLCCCMMENEIKTFMDAFIPNLSNESPVNSYRRVAAVCLTLICLYSKNPLSSFHVLYEECFKLLFHNRAEKATKFTIWGVLICFRNIIIHISELDKSKPNVESQRSLQPNTFNQQTVCEIYEICLLYLEHEDSSVVSASLECLQALMKHQPLNFGEILIVNGSIKESLLKSKKVENSLQTQSSINKSLSNSQLNSAAAAAVPPKLATILTAEDFKLNEFSTSLETNLSISSESLNNLMPSLSAADKSASDIDPNEIEDTLNSSMSNREVNFDFDQTAPTENEDFQDQNEASVEVPSESTDTPIDQNQASKDLNETIGAQFSDTEPPLTYLTRLLCHKYLLSGENGVLKPDKSVKVLVKALALDCISHAVSLMPNLVALSLSIDPGDEKTQYVHDVILYINHSDDKMKSNACNLIGSLIGAVLTQFDANYERWLNSLSEKSSILHIETLVNHLLNVIKNDPSNLSKKSAVSSLQLFLPTLLASKHSSLALNVILSILPLKNSPYNLVKCELVQLLALIDYKLVRYAENERQSQEISIDIQERVLSEVFLCLLGSEDNKLRLETAKALTHLIDNLCYYDMRKEGSGTLLLVAHSKSLVSRLNLISQLNNNTIALSAKHLFSHLKSNSYLNNFTQPFHRFIQQHSIQKQLNSPIEHNLNYVLPLIIQLLVESTDKYLIVGCLEFIDYMLQVYDPAIYIDMALIQDLLSLLQALINHSLIAYDLYLHEILMKLLGNLYSTLLWKVLTSKYDTASISQQSIEMIQKHITKKDQPFYLLANNTLLINYANKFYSHCMRLLCIISCVIDESSLPSSVTSNLSAGSNYVSNITSIIPTKVDEIIDAPATIPPSTTGSSNTQQNSSSSNPSEKGKESSTKSSFYGSFQHSSFYMKIYEATKISYASWKKSAHVGAYDKFTAFIRSTLSVFSQLLECALSANELARHLDEILLYLRVIFSIDAANSVKCVTQLLKALFGLNFTHLYLSNLVQSYNNSLSPAPKLSSMQNLAYLSSPNAPNSKSTLYTVLIKNSITSFNNFMHAQNSLFKSEQHQLSSLQASTTQAHSPNDDKNASNSLNASSSAPALSNTSTGSKLNPLNLFGMVRKKISSNADTSTPAPNKSQSGQQKIDSKTTLSYIRSFEAIVIKSLKHYTVSSSNHLQIRILDLLIQLINLKVNYSLLDSDKVFIEYVLRQFDYLEQRKCSLGGELSRSSAGDCYESAILHDYEVDSLHNPTDTATSLSRINQVSHALTCKHNEHQRAHILIPKLFEFLIVISYEKPSNEASSRQTTLINMPKLKQICDNLLASENSPHTHVIPALSQLVYNLFVNSRLNDLVNNPQTVHTIKDIELQRDVLLITLLKLCTYPQVWHLLTIVALKYKQEGNEEKWKRVSRQICDSIFTQIQTHSLNFYEFNGNETRAIRRFSPTYNPYLESVKYLIQLFTQLMPQVYRPIDFILISLFKLISEFNPPTNNQSNTATLNQWLCLCITHIHILICNSSEDIILSRLQDLIPQMVGSSAMQIDDHDLLSPAIYLAKYLMCIIDISFTHMQQLKQANRSNNFLTNSSLNFTYHLTYNLLNYVVFIVNCGFYKKLANSFRLITSEHQIVTTRLSNSYPLLGCLWQYFLLINGYEKCVYSLNDDESYEDEDNDSLSSRAHLTLNEKLFKYATLTIFSEHVSSDTSDMDITQPLTMMLINYLGEIFELCNESSVIYLISSIHRNSSASSLFLHTINSFWKKLTKLSVLQTCLKTLEGLHLSVSGNLLKLLVEKYFNLSYVSLVRYADYIACQRVEMMISLPLEELSAQLNDDDTHRLIDFFSNEFRYAFRHQRLISLLKKLSKRFQGYAPGSDSCIDEKMEKNDDCCEFLAFYSGDLDKEWFYNIVRSSCCVSQSANYHQISNSEILALKPKQCALMLSSLDYANLATILLSKDFKLSVLAECVMLGGRKTQEIVQNLPLSLINSASEKEFAHPLWLAATNCLFEMLNYRCVSLPSEQLTPAMYQSKLNELLSEMDLNSYIHPLNETINAYIQCVSQYSCLAQHNDEHQQDIITYLLFQFNLISHACAKQRLMIPHGQITESLHAIFNLLSNKVLLKLFIKRKHFIASISMIIRHFYELLFSYYLHESEEIVLTKPQIDYNTENQQNDIQFTIETFEILQQLKCLLNSHKKIPLSLRDLVTKIYIAISRLPIIDQFMRIPNQLWAIYRVNYDALVKCDSPIPPIDYLKDSHVLKEYLRHIQSVGWSSRAQFENEYVSMLQLLTSLSKEAESDELPLEELKERNRCICLIIRALASWLVKSTLTPSSGTPLNSQYELASRNRSPTFLYSPFGKQYLNVRLACEKYSRYGTFERQASIIHASNEYIAQALDPTLIQLLYKSIRSEQKRGELPLGDDLVNCLLGKLAVNTNRQAYYLYAQNLDRALLVDSERFTFGQVNLEALLKFLACWNSANVNAIGAISAAEQQQLYSSSSLANKAISNLMKVAEYFSEDEKVGNGLQEVVSTPDALVPRSFSRAGLDMASVLRTVFDYFETFFNSPKSCLQLRYDLLKSYMYLANTLFDSKTQYEQLNAKIEASFEWINEFMSDSVNLSQMPVVNELIDDSIVALCVYSACLAKACLFSTSQTLSGKDFDRLNKLFDNCLKTNSLTIKIAAVNAIIYWLELISYGYLNNISNSGVNISEYSKQIVDHLCKEVNQLKVFSVFATTNTRYISVLWSAMFFAIENCLDSIKDAQNFLNGFFKQTTNMLNDPNTPYYLFYQLFLGLERLLLTNMVPQNELNLINRIFSSKQSDEQRNLCFNVLQLTILYSSNQVNKKTNYWNDLIQKATTPANINSNNNNSGNETISSSISTDNFDFLQPKVAQFYLSKEVLQQQSGYPQIIELQSEPELQAALLKILEIVTGYFDKMKTSTTARESHMYASVLPQLLCDFLPPHDLLNKLITEFSNSSQHPYPESIAYVLYECFNLLQEKGLQSQIQEWCLLSVSNFVQRSNINESIWLLSCFLISVSKNMWLKATFPFVLNRYGACETIDKAIFFMAVIEFTKQLQDKSQVSSIYKTFECVAKPDTPYIELVKILANLQ